MHIERGNLIYDAVKLKIPPSITHTAIEREREAGKRRGVAEMYAATLLLVTCCLRCLCVCVVVCPFPCLAVGWADGRDQLTVTDAQLVGQA